MRAAEGRDINDRVRRGGFKPQKDQNTYHDVEEGEGSTGMDFAKEDPERVWRITVMVIQFSYRATDAAYNMNDSKE